MTLADAPKDSRVVFVDGRWKGRCATVLDEPAIYSRKILLDGPDEVDFRLEADYEVVACSKGGVG